MRFTITPKIKLALPALSRPGQDGTPGAGTGERSETCVLQVECSRSASNLATQTLLEVCPSTSLAVARSAQDEVLLFIFSITCFASMESSRSLRSSAIICKADM